MNAKIEAVAETSSKPNPRARFQYLTLTGPGTPAGALFRCYWHPVALESELGVDPLPMRILGEDLVFFIDDEGRPGALDRRCPHRCADLGLARLEDGGIRCPYHGWLFDVDGKCLEQPGEQSASSKDKVRARSYPLRKAGGVYWIYMGDGEPPLLPEFPVLRGSDEYRYVTKFRGDCNWMQAHEGNLDPVHPSFLHRIKLDTDDMKERWGKFADTSPKIDIEETDYGLRVFIQRAMADESKQTLRVSNFIMPNGYGVAAFETNLGVGGATVVMDVPIDDEHYWRWEFIYHRSGRLDRYALEKQMSSEKIPGTHVMWRQASDNYSQDRHSMKDGNYIGLGPCFAVHDLVITNSQGKIHQHENEHLAPSDVGIVKARRMLDEAVQAVLRGEDPRGVARDPDSNWFKELIIIQDVVDTGFDKAEFINRMANDEDLYRPLPMGE